ncbi:MAG: cytochrome d ubiquinol oxidase subunit II [Chlorobiaceae bacterium]
MDVQTIWFILIAAFFTAYFVLEGFDFGVGILLPFMSTKDIERRTIINTIGPFWDGNEMWLITAVGTMFAAFPNWYATFCSIFYPVWVAMLASLIFRGVAFEFRSKHDNPVWRNFWDWSIFGGSALPAVLWGIVLSNFIRGVPIDASMNYTGVLFNLFNPYTLVCGLTSLLIFTFHGAIFLSLKTTGILQETAMNFAKKLWTPAMLFYMIFTVYTITETDLYHSIEISRLLIPLISILALASVIFMLSKNASGWAFTMTTITIAFSTITIFKSLYPRVLVSSLNPLWSLTIYNTSSSSYTLGILTIVAMIFIPLIIIYQGWSYWIFHQRITMDSELEY